MFTEAWQCDCFLVSITSVRVRYDDDGRYGHDAEFVLERKGAGVDVKICTETLSMATYATPELSRMCYIACYGSFPGFP